MRPEYKGVILAIRSQDSAKFVLAIILHFIQVPVINNPPNSSDAETMANEVVADASVCTFKCAAIPDKSLSVPTGFSKYKIAFSYTRSAQGT